MKTLIFYKRRLLFSKLFSLSIVILIVTILSCKKNSLRPPGPVLDKGQITMNISLPNGSAINLNQASILSYPDSVGIRSGTCALDTSAVRIYSTQLMIGKGGEILMMHYSYPGEISPEFSPQSTALALVMDCPAVLSLNSKGKVNLIQSALSNPQYSMLLNAVTSSIMAGKSIVDTTNFELKKALSNLFNSLTSNRSTSLLSLEEQPINHKFVSSNHIMGYFDTPINFISASNQVNLINSASCSYAIGVYKSGNLVDSIFYLDGINYVATSLAEISSQATEGINPLSTDLSFPSDGTYSVRIRSGRSFDGTPESNKALLLNVQQLTINLLNWFPTFDKCALNFLKGRITFLATKLLTSPPTSPITSGQQAAQYMYDISVGVLSLSVDLALHCAVLDPIKDKISISYFKKFEKVASWMGSVGKIGNTLNAGIQLVSFVQARSAIDTCFSFQNNHVGKCQAAPDVTGKWQRSDSLIFTITQTGKDIYLNGPTDAYSHVGTAQWQSELTFSGRLTRTYLKTGCVTYMSILLTKTSPNQIVIDLHGLDHNCDISKEYNEEFVYSKIN